MLATLTETEHRPCLCGLLAAVVNEERSLAVSADSLMKVEPNVREL